ncbi:tenascin-X [Myxococcus landrumensis]|uniref:Tenascin-X n=1 Tax=Myxococcus landrumensis TaxID=2813577 RepID=A0ABX7N0F5_9BACT|nr:tenascin-X [Myxococcus landrumus]QSQ12194.1 tenascin-X [Myxococcus landrumus]
MKSGVWFTLVGASLMVFAACGDVSVEAPARDTARAESELMQCPCGGTEPMCQPCAYICGDNVCDTANGESINTCPEDCTPTPSCGDGSCNGSETSSSCAADCPAPPWCGDGVCNNAETNVSCASDCNSPTCGDRLCDLHEVGWCVTDCRPPACDTCPQEPWP